MRRVGSEATRGDDRAHWVARCAAPPVCDIAALPRAHILKEARVGDMTTTRLITYRQHRGVKSQQHAAAALRLVLLALDNLGTSACVLPSCDDAP